MLNLATNLGSLRGCSGFKYFLWGKMMKNFRKCLMSVLAVISILVTTAASSPAVVRNYNYYPPQKKPGIVHKNVPKAAHRIIKPAVGKKNDSFTHLNR
jgi:hypothetical protein